MAEWPLKLADLLAKWKWSHQKLISPALMLLSPGSGKNLFFPLSLSLFFFLTHFCQPPCHSHIYITQCLSNTVVLFSCRLTLFPSLLHLSTSVISTFVLPSSLHATLCLSLLHSFPRSVKALPKWWVSALLGAAEHGSQSNSFLRLRWLHCCLFFGFIWLFTSLLKALWTFIPTVCFVWNKMCLIVQESSAVQALPSRMIILILPLHGDICSEITEV